jgi:pimeloyl-ACP methyl ester carboxylesterase
MKDFSPRRTVVFIHGLFMNPVSWSPWLSYFNAKGYVCHAPAYPFHEGEPSGLRQYNPEGLGTLTLAQVVAHITSYIDSLPEKPILIGHSMGGLIVQKLINANKGVAGVCINSAPPKGILSFQWSFLKSNIITINPLKGNSIFLPSVKWFQYAFCNTMTLEQTAIEFEKYVVPESRNIPRSSTGKEGFVDMNQPHNPLLFIAGEDDHIIPPDLNIKNFESYADTNSRKDFKLFPGRTHYICGQENWEEVALYIENWIEALNK